MDDLRKLTDTEQFAYRQSEAALGRLRQAIQRLEQTGESLVAPRIPRK